MPFYGNPDYMEVRMGPEFKAKKSNTKKLRCGCVKDTLNNATEQFCEEHQKEHNAWVLSRCPSTVC